MAKKMIETWYLGEEDKEQIKSYSKQISILFKITGYKPGLVIDYYFNPERFDFIPCIKEWIDCNEVDSFKCYPEVRDALDSAYNSSVNVTIEGLKKLEMESSEEEILEHLLERKDKDTVHDLLEFICLCDDDVKQKFINWIME